MKKPDQGEEVRFSRRDLFRRAGAFSIVAAGSAAMVPLPALEAVAPPQAEALHAVQSLTAQQFETLSAITGRIIPADATGPGALEAHAATYIDKALNSHYNYQKDDYAANLAAVDAYSKATHGKNFAALPADKQDAVLSAMENNNPGNSFGFVPDARTFFNLVLDHTQEGMFSDPYYGGNANFIGWDLLDFPGVKLEFSATEQQLDYPIVKAHRSAYSYAMFNGREEVAMAINLPKTDVVTIGLGGAAGVAVLPLAEAGAKIIGLEAGGWLTPADFPSDELRNNILTWMGNSKFNRDAPTWRPNDKVKSVRRRIGGPMMSAVGGSTIHFGAQAWRWAPWVFTSRSSSIARYGPGSIPSNSTLADWPVTYSDLEPFYDKVEQAIGVSGLAGNISGKLNPEGNTFEGPRSRDYPMPPLRSTGYTQMIWDAAKRIGWNPFLGPSAINSVPRDGRGTCQYHGFCQPNGCPHNAKGSPNVTTIPKAMATKNLTVVTEARVTRIEVDRQGRATGVLYIKGGKEYFQPASVVILSAYTYENVRLLLLSKSQGFPKGLANNSGQVGKHYIGHQSGGLNAIFPGKKLNRFTGTVAQRTSVDNWNADHFDHSGLGFIGGGNIAMWMEAYPIATSRTVPPGTPRWGAAYKAYLRANGNSIGAVYLPLDTLPYEEHVLDLDPDNSDAEGRPLLRVTNGLQEQERLRANFVRQKATELCKEAGASTVWGAEIAPPQLSSHALGGTRMGLDPATSVVNNYGLAHEVPNLMVMGGSVLVSHGGSNPTLTLQAVAWRNAEHLVANWSSIAKSSPLKTSPAA